MPAVTTRIERYVVGMRGLRIAVASGKGGTGKTLVTANLSAVAGTNIADLDVEEPNAFLYFDGEAISSEKVNRPVPLVDEEICDLCGKCVEVCAFNALVRLPQTIKINEELCHGCGACSHLCPLQAIEEVDHEVGDLITMRSGDRTLIHGRLKIGEANAIPLISAVKAAIPPDRAIILDCPPGTSCTMVEAVRGSDYAIMVTEPTPFGAHDLNLALDVLERLEVPHGVFINKVGMDGVDIEEICRSRGKTVLASLPFDREIARRHAQGLLLVEDSGHRQTFLDLWDAVNREVGA